MVEEGWTYAAAAKMFMACPRTAKKWADRYRAEGTAGMTDRSSRPRSSPTKTPPPVVRRIVALRWRHRLGPVQIAGRLGLAASTVHAVLVRCRLNRLTHIDRVTGEPIRRYEHTYPGSMIHVDVTKFANIPDGGGQPEVVTDLTIECYYLRMDADTRVCGVDPWSEYVDLAAEVLGLLSDPTRIRIVLALRKADELPVNALAEIVGKKPSGVSQHLARLRMARMVTTRQEGTSVLYRLTDEHGVALVIEAVKQAEHAVANGQIPPHHHAPQR